MARGTRRPNVVADDRFLWSNIRKGMIHNRIIFQVPGGLFEVAVEVIIFLFSMFFSENLYDPLHKIASCDVTRFKEYHGMPPGMSDVPGWFRPGGFPPGGAGRAGAEGYTGYQDGKGPHPGDRGGSRDPSRFIRQAYPTRDPGRDRPSPRLRFESGSVAPLREVAPVPVDRSGFPSGEPTRSSQDPQFDPQPGHEP